MILQLKQAHDQREQAIKRCINESSSRVKTLKAERQQNDSDLDALKRLRKEQTKLRLMQNELNVDEVVKDRTLKVI